MYLCSFNSPILTLSIKQMGEKYQIFGVLFLRFHCIRETVPAPLCHNWARSQRSKPLLSIKPLSFRSCALCQSLTRERTTHRERGIGSAFNTTIFICRERRAFPASFYHYEGLRIEAFRMVNHCFVRSLWRHR